MQNIQGDKTVQYIKAKNMILEYLNINDTITSGKIQERCGFTKQQARGVIDKMRNEGIIFLCKKGKKSYYVKNNVSSFLSSDFLIKTRKKLEEKVFIKID